MRLFCVTGVSEPDQLELDKASRKPGRYRNEEREERHSALRASGLLMAILQRGQARHAECARLGLCATKSECGSRAFLRPAAVPPLMLSLLESIEQSSAEKAGIQPIYQAPFQEAVTSPLPAPLGKNNRKKLA